MNVSIIDTFDSAGRQQQPRPPARRCHLPAMSSTEISPVRPATASTPSKGKDFVEFRSTSATKPSGGRGGRLGATSRPYPMPRCDALSSRDATTLNRYVVSMATSRPYPVATTRERTAMNHLEPFQWPLHGRTADCRRSPAKSRIQRRPQRGQQIPGASAALFAVHLQTFDLEPDQPVQWPLP